jgi:hypothetical protein
LSSDPERYPLESRIAPLVFELKRLQVFQPCWSCEGHNRKDGTLWKVPRVWFYAESVVHVRVLADAIKELALDGELNGAWQVVTTYSDDDNAETTFSLEPGTAESGPGLSELQQDLEVIARHLRPLVTARARKLRSTVR